MKFSKHFPSTSSMSGFTSNTAPSPSTASAPPSALDLVPPQTANSWESLLSPIADSSSTSNAALADETDLVHTPSYLLSNSQTTFDHQDLEHTAPQSTDPLSWDPTTFSTSKLRPSALAPTVSSAYSSTFSMMPMDAQAFASYPFGSYPLLPVLPFDLPRSSTMTPDDAPTTVSPAAVSFSTVAPLSLATTMPNIATATSTTVPKEVSTPVTSKASRSREGSMDVDDMEGDDDDDEDMDEEDNEDEYKERVRGPRKDAKLNRSLLGLGSRKVDSDAHSVTSAGPTGAKRGKASGSSKQASGSENGSSTPAPTKRRGATRIAVADFVPPDVTGLSKREARLVKNRAAAFLSRQRKREEFEQMEIRLQEVLEENARLKSGAPVPSSSEVQRLQEALRHAQEREEALKKELEEKSRLAAMKVDEPTMTVQEALKLATPMVQSPRSDISSLDGSVLSKEKDSTRAHSGPGFNLMVLVFSLTLLGMPHQHQLQNVLRGAGAQPTRITYEPSGSSTASTFPSLFSNVLERWEGTNRIQSLDGLEPVDEDDEMEVEVEPWEQEEAASNDSKKGNSYVVDFEMPVLADEVGKDEEGKIKVRISPCGVPRPRQATGDLKPGELAWDGSTLPPVDAALSSSSFVSDWETWGGWKEFLSDDITGGSSLLPPTTSIDDAASPLSDFGASPVENTSERWATPPPFPLEETISKEPESTLANVLSGERAPVDVDVSLSTLPAWSRALVHAAAGEKLKARIRVSKKSRVAGRTKKTGLSLGKKKMGLVVKV